MITIEADELAERAAEIVRHVKKGETVQLVDGDIAIATITPLQRVRSQEDAQAFIEKLDRMAEELSKYVTGPVDAVQAVCEIRREL